MPSITEDLQPTSTQLLWIIDIYGSMVAGLQRLVDAAARGALPDDVIDAKAGQLRNRLEAAMRARAARSQAPVLDVAEVRASMAALAERAHGWLGTTWTDEPSVILDAVSAKISAVRREAELRLTLPLIGSAYVTTARTSA